MKKNIWIILKILVVCVAGYFCINLVKEIRAAEKQRSDAQASIKVCWQKILDNNPILANEYNVVLVKEREVAEKARFKSILSGLLFVIFLIPFFSLFEQFIMAPIRKRRHRKQSAITGTS